MPGITPVTEVHLWCADPMELESAAAWEAARKFVTPDELERLERLHFARDRYIFLAGRVLLRTVLSNYQAVPPADWCFVINEYGRPRIAATPDSPIDFNVAKTDGLVVCAVARCGEIGVDAENCRPAPLFDVADRFFAPAEIAALRALPPEQRLRRFYDYWTLKESYINARGSVSVRSGD